MPLWWQITRCPKYRLFIKTSLLILFDHNSAIEATVSLNCWTVLIRDIKGLLKWSSLSLSHHWFCTVRIWSAGKIIDIKNTKSGKIWNRRLHSSYSVAMGLLPLCKLLICWDLTDIILTDSGKIILEILFLCRYTRINDINSWYTISV